MHIGVDLKKKSDENYWLGLTLPLLVEDHLNDWESYPDYQRRLADVDRILWWIHKPRRLEKTVRSIKEGLTLPLVRLSEYRVDDEWYYVVSDGNHRSCAYHILGLGFIGAKVSSWVQLKSLNYVIHSGTLWKQVTPGRMKMVSLGKMDKEYVITLRKLGVEVCSCCPYLVLVPG
jgi:hypothetical protein